MKTDFVLLTGSIILVLLNVHSTAADGNITESTTALAANETDTTNTTSSESANSTTTLELLTTSISTSEASVSTTEEQLTTANTSQTVTPKPVAGDEVPKDTIIGLPLPVFITIVSFFGTPIIFILMCGAFALCKSLPCYKVSRNVKISPGSNFPDSGDHEMRDFPVKLQVADDMEEKRRHSGYSAVNMTGSPIEPRPTRLPPINKGNGVQEKQKDNPYLAQLQNILK